MKRVQHAVMVQIDLFAERVAPGESGKAARGRLPRLATALKVQPRKTNAPASPNQLASRLRAAAQAD